MRERLEAVPRLDFRLRNSGGEVVDFLFLFWCFDCIIEMIYDTFGTYGITVRAILFGILDIRLGYN